MITILQSFAAVCIAPAATMDNMHAFRLGDIYAVDKVQGCLDFWYRVHVCPGNYTAMSSEKFSQYFMIKG